MRHEVKNMEEYADILYMVTYFLMELYEEV